MKSQDEERGAALRAEFPYTGVLFNVSRVQNRASQAAIRPHGRAEDQTASATTDVDSHESGPGFLYTRFEGQMDGIAVNALTAVGPEQLHVTHRYHARNRCDPAIANAFFDYSVNERNLDESI